MQPSKSTILRTVLLIIALINMALAMLGIVPEELVGNDKLYEIGSIVVTAVVSLINAWYNNSFTSEAVAADEYLKKLKDENASGKAA